MGISKEKTDKSAKLEKLNLPDTTLKSLQTEFNKIVRFMSKLNEVNTSGAEPLSYFVDVMNVTRTDEIELSLSAELALSGASQKSGACFKAPKVIIQ